MDNPYPLFQRDEVFISNFWKELFKVMGAQLQQSTSYHPQEDGETEELINV